MQKGSSWGDGVSNSSLAEGEQLRMVCRIVPLAEGEQIGKGLAATKQGINSMKAYSWQRRKEG